MVYNCLVTFRSSTEMYKGKRIFNLMKIPSRAVRPPLAKTGGSCGYGLEIDDRYARRCIEALMENNVAYGKTFSIQNDTYREVMYGLFR